MGKALAMWMLITVSYGGTVSTNNFPTAAACRDGESIARTGLTIDEAKARDQEAGERRKKAADEWRAAHPPREPKDDYERKLVAARKKGDQSRILGSTSPYITAGDDFLIYEWPGSGSGLYFSTDRSGDIKFSKCIGPIVEETKP